MLIPVSKNKIHQVFGASGYMVRTFTKFIDDLTPNGIPHRKECLTITNHFPRDTVYPHLEQ